MDSTSKELSLALKQWVNSFRLVNPVQTWADLRDGDMIWKILKTIDSDYFQSALPESETKSIDNWIPRWQNWKFIEKEVLWYIRDECGKLPGLNTVMRADLKAVAMGSSDQEVLKIIKCVLLAAMYSEKSNEQMVEILSALGPKVAQPIATFLAEMEELDQNMTDMEDEESTMDEAGQSTPHDTNDSAERDLELERESRMIQALQDRKRAEAQLADALAELEELKKKHASLRSEFEDSKYALESVRQTGASRGVAQLHQRADQDREYIEKLETDLADATTTVEQQLRQIDRFKSDADNRQLLRDELQLATNERDELRQKAKANENLRKKIQILQEQERVTQSLRHDLQVAHEQLQEVEALKDRCSALEKANEENAQTIANGEQEIFDQKTAKRMLEHELSTISYKWEQSREMLASAQDTIRELEDGLHDDTSSSRQNASTRLDAELRSDGEGAVPTQLSKPQDRGKGFSADVIVLQQKLSITAASVDRLEKRCLDLLQENLGYKSVLDDATSDSHVHSHPFVHTTRRLEILTVELDKAKNEYIEVALRAADLQRRSDEGNSETAADGTSPIDLNVQCQKYTNDLEQTIQDHRSLLRHALLGNDALQKVDAEQRAATEWRMWKHQLENVTRASTDESASVIRSTATNITDRIESVRGALTARDAIIAARDAELLREREDLSLMRQHLQEGRLKDPHGSKEQQRQLRQSQRENQLIASAWYDLTCRLQSNNVHLSRRTEAGRGWLSKMRSAVNSTSLTDRTLHI